MRDANVGPLVDSNSTVWKQSVLFLCYQLLLDFPLLQTLIHIIVLHSYGKKKRVHVQ